jgi:hypothetical protein
MRFIRDIALPRGGAQFPPEGVMAHKIDDWFDKMNAFIERHYLKLLFFAAGYFLHGIVMHI